MGAAVSLRVVLDTNIVVSALVFTSGRLAWIRHAWQQGTLVPLVCKQTVEELLRVLAYPKFKLSASEREDVLADFLPYTQNVILPPVWPEAPTCRDPKDQVFVVLAQTANADALVSGDDDLLSMHGQVAFPILPAQALAELVNPASYSAS